MKHYLIAWLALWRFGWRLITDPVFAQQILAWWETDPALMLTRLSILEAKTETGAAPEPEPEESELVPEPQLESLPVPEVHRSPASPVKVCFMNAAVTACHSEAWLPLRARRVKIIWQGRPYQAIRQDGDTWIYREVT